MYVVALGNAFDGMRIVGPFEDFDEAENMMHNIGSYEYYIVEVDEEL